MAILYVREQNTREIIAIVEDFLSLVWTERYQEYGDFVLDMPVTIENVNLFKKGRYISLDDSEESMIIQTINITESFGDEEEPNLEISGSSVTSILERRVNFSRITQCQEGSINYNGIFSNVMQSIVNDDLISPIKSYWTWYHKETLEGSNEHWEQGYDVTASPSDLKIMSTTTSDPDRAIKDFVFKNNVESSYDISIDTSYSKIKTLYDLISSICKRYLMGFRVIINSDNKFEFQAYSGKDRTTSQKLLDPIIFDPIMDNISYVNYYDDSSKYKNTWITYINGYLCPRRPMGTNDWNTQELASIYQGYSWGTSQISSSFTDLDRIEIPFKSDSVDDVSSIDTDEAFYTSINDIEVDGQDQYEEGEYEIITTSEGSIDPLVRYRYGVDYFIGDRVDITNNSGVVMTGIINEVVKSYDSDGIKITPNFLNMTEYDYGYEDDDIAEEV